jgi:prephenate dehydrogenase
MTAASLPENAPPFQHLTVIGCGLIGGSFLMAAREAWPELDIQAVDRDGETLRYLLKHEHVNRVSLTLPEAFEESHLVVLATHLSGMKQVLPQLADRVRGGDILVSDVGSCKRSLVELGESLLPGQFIGGHPMAGKEHAGVQHATSLLFTNKRYLLCPPAALLESDLLRRLQRFLTGFGVRLATVKPCEHDRIMAHVSHLPQLYAVLLGNLLFDNNAKHLLSYHGGGMDDQLRLTGSPYAMWGDIYRENADNMRDVLSEIIDKLTLMRDHLDGPELADWFERANTVYHLYHGQRR